MRSRLVPILAGAAAIVVAATVPASAGDGAMLAFRGGAYDTGAFGGRHDTAALFGAEYRTGWEILGPIAPMVGGFVTSDATVYGYGGFYADLKLGDLIPGADRIYVTPSAAVGAWGRGDANKDLGSVLEFRTGVEVSYRFDNGQRLGVSFHHLSNADISSQNPGEENVAVSYVIPIESLIGR